MQNNIIKNLSAKTFYKINRKFKTMMKIMTVKIIK